MGVGTSAFEKQFASELAALRAEEAIAGVVDGTFVHDLIGMAFRLPIDWLVRNLKEVADTAEGRLISSHHDELNDAFRLLSNDFLPIVTVSAPPLDDPVARLGPHEISPVAVLQLEEVISTRGAKRFDLSKHVATDLAHFHGYVENFRLTAPPELATLGGCDAVHYTATYTVLHADAAEGCPMREHAYYVLHRGVVFALRLCDFPERDRRLAFDFDEFVRAIAFR